MGSVHDIVLVRRISAYPCNEAIQAMIVGAQFNVSETNNHCSSLSDG